jgi:hypothetical protein
VNSRNSPVTRYGVCSPMSNSNLVKQVDPRGNVQGANPDDYATTFTYDAAHSASSGRHGVVHPRLSAEEAVMTLE